jgi:hypothetical protein
MIFQSFNKGGGDRVNYGLYEYVAGADIIYDFGNPICTSAFNSSRIVYNVGSVNVTGSLIPYANPSNVYPTLGTNYGGIANFNRQAGAGTNYVQWDWKSTQEQTNIFIYQAPTGSVAAGEMGFPGGTSPSADSIYITLNKNNNVFGGGFNSSDTQFDDIFDASGSTEPSTLISSSWNTIAYTSNGASISNLYLNESTPILSTTTITRVTSGTQTFKFPFITGNTTTNFQSAIMGFLQYPFILTPKQIRQTYKVFSQRFFLP